MSWEQPVIRRVNYWLWLYRLIAWDSLLPIIIVAVPLAIRFCFPNGNTLLDLVTVFLPIGAFFIRFGTGYKHITTNLCSFWFRLFQMYIFFLGIFALVLFDAFVILSNLFPNIQIFRNLFPDVAINDHSLIGIFIGIYFLMMTVAMYPGRTVVEIRDQFNINQWPADN